MLLVLCFFFFFFNDTATTEIYTLSLHDALPIFRPAASAPARGSSRPRAARSSSLRARGREDRKSTRLNSSHRTISYAVFCLKKKKKNTMTCIVIKITERRCDRLRTMETNAGTDE